jgi:hypothetical protein
VKNVGSSRQTSNIAHSAALFQNLYTVAAQLAENRCCWLLVNKTMLAIMQTGTNCFQDRGYMKMPYAGTITVSASDAGYLMSAETYTQLSTYEGEDRTSVTTITYFLFMTKQTERQNIFETELSINNNNTFQKTITGKGFDFKGIS